MSYPFSVVEKGATLTKEIEVTEFRPYVFELAFAPIDGQDMRAFRRMLDGDGRPESTGINIPVSLQIWKLDKGLSSMIHEQLINTRVAYAWSPTDLSRLLGYVPLRPGRYRIQLTNVEGKAELVNVRVTFSIGIHPKSSTVKER